MTALAAVISGKKLGDVGRAARPPAPGPEMRNELVAADLESAHVHWASRIAVPIGDVHPEIRAGRSGLFRSRSWSPVPSLVARARSSLPHCGWFGLLGKTARSVHRTVTTRRSPPVRDRAATPLTATDSSKAHPTFPECGLPVLMSLLILEAFAESSDPLLRGSVNGCGGRVVFQMPCRIRVPSF